MPAEAGEPTPGARTSRDCGLGPNVDLIGHAGSRRAPITPALVLDLDRLEANIAAVASHARTHDYRLTPTAKIHKSPEIARRQIAAGNTTGICCSTLAEAEALVDEGIPGVLLFSTVVAPSKIERLAALNAPRRRTHRRSRRR